MSLALLMASNNEIQFRDSELKAYSSADGNLDLDADTQINFRVSATSQIILTDGVLRPATDNDVDLGTSTIEFKNAYFDGRVTTDGVTNAGTLTQTGNATMTAALYVGGAVTMASSLTISGSTTAVDVRMTGNQTLLGNLTMSGTTITIDGLAGVNASLTVYNDGVTSGQLTGLTVTDGLITGYSTVP